MLYLLIGIISGAVGGMGIGGGAVLIPVINLFSDLNQHSIQGLNLISFIPSSASATFIYFRDKRLKWKLIRIVSISAVAGALLGAWCVTYLESNLLRKLFGGFLFIVGIVQWVSAEKRHKKTIQQKQNER
jgi:uncharacterized membrane protein YfcA